MTIKIWRTMLIQGGLIAMMLLVAGLSPAAELSSASYVMTTNAVTNGGGSISSLGYLLESAIGQSGGIGPLASSSYAGYAGLFSEPVTTTFRGALTTTDSFRRPDLSEAATYVAGTTAVIKGLAVDPNAAENVGATTVVTEGSYNYYKRSFTPAVDGLYTIAVTSANLSPGTAGYGYGTSGSPVPATDDTTLFVYSSFDPDNGAGPGFMYGNDDKANLSDGLNNNYSNGNDFKSYIPNIQLTGGTTYTIVVTSSAAGVTGSIDFEITGPSGVTLSPLAPTAATAAAGGITGISAVLNGTVSDNGANTTVSFDYGATTGYGANVAATTGGTVSAGAGSTAVARTITGLTCNTTYHYRVNGVNSLGSANGNDQSFTTATCSAALSALVAKNGATALTLTPAFASATPTYAALVPSSAASITVTPTVADATATVKVNGAAVASGAASAAIPLAVGVNSIPVVVTAQDGVITQTYAINVTRLAADGSGTLTVSPASATASATGRTFAFTYTAAAGGMSNGEIDITVSSLGTGGSVTATAGTAAISGGVLKVTGVTLAEGATATITWSNATVVATAGSKSLSTTQKATTTGTLTSLAASPAVTLGAAPSAITGAATGVSGTVATLNGTVSDNGAATTVSFDYGPTTAYGTNLAATTNATIAAGSGSKSVAVTLSGLSCGGVTYHYRINAVNGSGATNGSDMTFTTSTACPPTVTTPTASASANMATLTLQSDTTGTGYFTLLPGNNAACGTAMQTRTGQDSSGAAAFRIGSLALTANTQASYTVRNLKESTPYTVCFTADKNGVLATPASANVTTQAAATYTNPGWSAAGPAGFSAGSAENTSLAFAPDGTPYVAYQDYGNSGKATVMRYNGTAWSAVGTAGFSAGKASYTSLAFAPDGTPYLAYRDSGGSATVMKYNGGAWSALGTTGFFSAGLAKFTSLSFAPDGTLYLAYQDSGNSYGATVVRYNGTAWVPVGWAGFSAGKVSYTSLSFAPDGTPYLAYRDFGNSYKATVMKYNGTAWVAVGTAGFSAGAASYTSLSFAPDGAPYVAYQDGGNGFKATVMRYDGTAWVGVGKAGFSAGWASSTSLAFAPDGTPYLAYQDGDIVNRATVMKYNGTGWVAVGKAGFSADEAFSTSLAFAPDGTPYVAYQNSSYFTGKATVMRLGNMPALLPPTVTGVAPASGPISGGTSVTITGTGFTGATAVTFGSANATSYTVNSDSQITAVSPAASAGTVHIAVTTSGGTSASGTADQFTSVAPTYSVTYNGNGATSGSVPTDANSYLQGAQATVAGNSGSLVKSGSTFSGWNTVANGSGTSYAIAATFPMGAANVTLYAQWIISPPAISSPTVTAVATTQATLNLQSGATGTGYFTLLAGTGTACGTGSQVRAGLTASGGTAPFSGSLALTANTAASSIVRNLTANSPYSVCFTADTGGIAATPATVNFTTLPLVTAPTLTTGAASSVTANGAVLNATVNDNGASTTVSFDYGTTTAYGTNLAATTGATVASGAGNTAASLTLSGLTCNTLYHFRVGGVNSAGASNGSDAVFTTAACPAAPAISTQPADATVNSGANTAFTVAATGADLTYQWQVNSGSGFANISNGDVYSGAATATLAITGATAGMNGYAYRVVVSGVTSPAATSTGATLTVNTPPAITTQPTGARVHSGVTTQLTVSATGTGLTYQWQVDTGSGFGNITNGGVYSNATTATLTITGVTAGMDGYNYRVVVSGSLSPAVTSNSATLTVLTVALPITSGTWPSSSWTLGGNASSSGATLTLTPALNDQTGFAFFNDAFFSTLGLNVTFDYYSGGGTSTGADGFSFFLIDGAAAPVSPGASGGGLGYSRYNDAYPGLVGGWVGIGFDEYGGFSATPTGTARAQSIAIRGQAPGYAFITNGKPSFNIDGGNRKVNITVDKNQKITVQISADNGVTWQTPINNVDLGQALPASNTFKLGFAASTGGLNNIHRVSNVVVTLPGDDSIAGSALAATAANGATVNFNLNLCPQNTAVLQPDTKATIAVTGSGLSFAQTSYGPYDLSGGSCVDVPVSATVTASGGGTYSYTATVSSSDTGFGDVNLINNIATQSGTVLVPPSVTTGAAGGVSATGATLNATVSANGAATTVSFDYGTTSGYGSTATSTQSPLAAGSANNTAVSAAVSGLACNTTYHFRVKGVSGSGTTNASDATFTTLACVPGAPTGATATAGDAQAQVSFSAPASDGGSAVTGYTVTSSPGNRSATGAAGPLTVTGLTNGVTYTFTVTAANSAGSGAASAASNSVTPKGNQSIGAISFNPASLTVGGAAMASAQATSGLSVGFTSQTPSICTVNGTAITGVAPGTCTITADQAGDGSYNAAPQVSQTITVTKASQTVSFLNPTVVKTYGAADFGPGASVSTGLGLTYASDNTAVATITGGGMIHIVGAGSATITADQAGDATHFPASATMALTVNKATLTVTADNAARQYAAADPVFTATYSGFVKGETAAVLSGAPVFTTSAVNTSPPDSYTITPALGTLAAANYEFTFVTGTLAVGIETQSITFNPIAAKTYGAAPFSLTATGGASGNPVVFSSSNTNVATINGSTVTIVGAGTTVITASQAESPGYASATAQQTLTVNKAPLMVTAGSAERYYGDPTPPFTVSYSGFVNNETQAVLTGAPAITTTATATSPTGAYPITPAAGTLTAANYSFIFSPGTLAVNLALQNIAFNQMPAKTYGAAAFDPGATGGGSGNPVTYTSSDPSVATASGSTITITGAGQAIITASQAGNDNYASAQAQQFLTVNPAPLTVTADNAGRVYGQANPGLTVTYGGFVNGDDPTKLGGAPVVATTADTDSVAGSYPITVAAGNLSSNNYSLSYADGTLTITKAPATATLDAASLSRTYDATAKAATATTNPVGLYVNMSYTDASSNPVTNPVNAGTYAVSGVISDPNYSGTTSGTLTIAKANQTITFPNATVAKTYGNADFGPGATASSGLPVTYTSSDLAVATITGNGLVHVVGAGTATITATQAGNANFNPATATQTLTVGKAELTVTANNASRVAGVADPAFSATYSGFVNGENASVITGATTFTTSADINSPAGSYTITPVTAGLSAANYSFTALTGTLAVGIAGQNIVFNPLKTRTYGVAPFELTATGGGSGLPVTFESSNPAVATISGTTVTITGAGQAVITASQAGNSSYAAATARQTLTVTPAVLMVTANSVSRHFGDPDPVFTATYSGFVNNDDQSVLTGAPAITTSAGSTSPVGSYPITPAAGTLAATNYSFIFAPGTLGVDLAIQTITFNPLPAMNYGDAPFNPGATGDASGNPVTYASSDPSVAVVSGSTVTITGTGQAIITANQEGNWNYASATAQQLLTVNPATLTVTAVDANRVYGAANPAFTARYTGFVNGEDQSKLTGAPTFATTADTSSPAGSYPITAASGNLFSNNYTFVYENGALTVGQATPVITWANPDAVTYGAALGNTQLNATADVAGSFSYAPPAGTVLDAGIGQTMTATFTPTDTTNYTTATGYAYISVAKAAQTITFGTAPAVAVGGTGTVSATGGGSTATVTYSSLTSGVCTVSGATVSGLAAGTCTIAADQAGDANYNAAPQATRNITIGKATATVTLAGLSQTYDGTAKPVTATTVPAGMTVDITYNGSSTAPTNGGAYAVVATISDANYSGSASGTLTIAKATQTVTFLNPAVTRTYGAADFGPGAAASTGLAVTYTSDNTAVATITSSGLVHITGAGTATITATQAGDDNNNPATAQQTLTVDKAVLTVTANNASRAFGAADPGFSATYAGFVNGENASLITGAPTFTTNADINSPVGSYPITPAPGDLAAANYSFSFAPGTLAVGIASQTIVFNPLSARTYGAAPFDLTATGGGSGNPVTFSSSNPAVATVTGSTVTITGAGQAVITASQAGNSNYASATAQQTLTVTPAMLLVSAVNAERFYWDPNPEFSVTYEGFVNGEDHTVLSGAPAVTTNATGTSPTGSYPITPAAGSLFSNNYSFIFAPATLAVNIAGQTIFFNQIPATTYGAAPFDLSAGGGGSGNPVSFSSSNPAVATVNGSTVTITGAGTAIITAKQEGNSNYAPATAQRLLTVNPATLTVTADNKSRAYGAANPGFSVTYSGFVNNETQAVLAGAPAPGSYADASSSVGSYPITVAEGNLFSSNYAFSYANGVLTVGQATPVITWSNPTSVTYGAALGNTQLNATADVAGSFSYAPPVGTVLDAGIGQTLIATFTPTDTTNYTTATGYTFISVDKAAQSITFGPAPTVLVGGTGTLSATGGGSANAVVFGSTTPAVCTVSGATITGLTSDTCTIAASQAGNANYNDAPQVTQTIRVGKLAQTIAFGSLATLRLGDADLDPGASASSGLAVAYASSNPAVVTVVNGKLHVAGLGNATITAHQSGNAVYLAAASVTRTLTVGYNTAPPLLIVSALSDGATTTETTQNISGKISDINGIRSVTVNGNIVHVNPDGSFSFPVQLLAGANTVTVVATNNAGATSTDTRTLNLDSTAPRLTVSYPPDNAVAFQQTITVTGTIAELLNSGKTTGKTVASTDPTLTVSYTINGSAPQAASLTDTTYSFTTNLDDGMNTIRVSAATVEGKKVEAKRTVSYQLPTFSIAVTDPAADIRMIQDSYLLTGNVADNTTEVTVTITMDGQSFTPQVVDGVFRQPLSFNEDKTYQISVTGTDQNNNSLTVQRNIIRSVPKTAAGESAPFTIIDALQALRIAVGIVTPDNSQILRMDAAPMINGVSVGDGRIDIEDTVVILRMAVGLIQ